MFKEFFDSKHHQRRIYSMFRNPLKKMLGLGILVVLMAAFVVSLPNIVLAGQDQTDQTFVKIEPGSFVVGYWDLRDRESFFQVTNVSGAGITVHVQTFNASDLDPEFQNRCTEFDFFDTYTGNDTHVYNIRNLTRNDGTEIFPPILTDGHGYIVVSVQSGSGGCAGSDGQVLLANFRIIDTLGNYEYRALALGDHGDDSSVDKEVFAFNFNNVDDTTFSDVVFMNMQINDPDPGPCQGDPKEFRIFRELVDLNENILSCDDRPLLGCKTSGVEETTVPLVNVGVNQFLENSRGLSSLCS